MRRSLQLLSLALVALVSAALLPACTSTSTNQPLIAAPSSPVSDVPIPAGFTMDTVSSRSDVIPNTNLRFVDHQYKGSDDFTLVVRFYHDQLPSRGWTFVSQHQVGDRVTMEFSKAQEELTITVWEGTFDTHINARLSPTGRKALVP